MMATEWDGKDRPIIHKGTGQEVARYAGSPEQFERDKMEIAKFFDYAAWDFYLGDANDGRPDRIAPAS
jgi:hypothetical protein